MNDVLIRIATPADAALIADLSRETFYNAFGPFNTEANMRKFMDDIFTRDKLMQELDLPDNIFLAAFVNDLPAGYVRMRDKAKPETNLKTNNVIEIARIYTSTNLINKGVGSALMSKCVSIAREMKRDIIWLGVWEHNPKAIKFYERFGFEKFGEHPFLLSNDLQTDWLMMKTLL